MKKLITLLLCAYSITAAHAATGARTYADMPLKEALAVIKIKATRQTAELKERFNVNRQNRAFEREHTEKMLKNGVLANLNAEDKAVTEDINSSKECKRVAEDRVYKRAFDLEVEIAKKNKDERDEAYLRKMKAIKRAENKKARLYVEYSPLLAAFKSTYENIQRMLIEPGATDASSDLPHRIAQASHRLETLASELIANRVAHNATDLMVAAAEDGIEWIH